MENKDNKKIKELMEEVEKYREKRESQLETIRKKNEIINGITETFSSLIFIWIPILVCCFAFYEFKICPDRNILSVGYWLSRLFLFACLIILFYSISLFVYSKKILDRNKNLGNINEETILESILYKKVRNVSINLIFTEVVILAFFILNKSL